MSHPINQAHYSLKKSQMTHLEDNYQLVLEYRKKSRNRIIDNYTWDKIVNQYQVLLNSL